VGNRQKQRRQPLDTKVPADPETPSRPLSQWTLNFTYLLAIVVQTQPPSKPHKSTPPLSLASPVPAHARSGAPPQNSTHHPSLPRASPRGAGFECMLHVPTLRIPTRRRHATPLALCPPRSQCVRVCQGDEIRCREMTSCNSAGPRGGGQREASASEAGPRAWRRSAGAPVISARTKILCGTVVLGELLVGLGWVGLGRNTRSAVSCPRRVRARVGNGYLGMCVGRGHCGPDAPRESCSGEEWGSAATPGECQIPCVAHG
jgi:hypothetical protein